MGFRVGREIEIIRRKGFLYELRQGDLSIVVSKNVLEEMSLE